ncbi:alpha/beta fold hydrolase [Actinomadura atramentaria]|uniref:alpha/beta fold hydrolase n=1 Tax=Actinomadura atramentaria TaxID=1990 RepID=UPI00036E124F|nr:alpha/beta fold hydrolase [Actinomadura atramentaria]
MAATQRITSFQRAGLTFDVTDQGPLDGEVIILLHGFPQSSSSWNELAPLLHAEGYRTLAPNQRGYSPRARPKGRLAYRLKATTEDALALINVVGQGHPVHVIGHDWGAAVAWSLASTHPEAVKTLTALSVPHPAAFMRSLFTSTQFLRSWYMFAFQIPWLPEQVALWLARTSRPRMITGMAATGQTAVNAARDIDYMTTPGTLTAAMNWYRAMPFGSPSQLRRIKVPTLYIYSDKDTALGPKAAKLTANYITAPYTFHTLKGIGHWIPEQAPKEVAALLHPHLSRHHT